MIFISDIVKAVQRSETTLTIAHIKKIYSLLDLTDLNTEDDVTQIIALCHKAMLPADHVAAVCVYPRFVKRVRQILKYVPVKVATVANFPHGTMPFDNVIFSIQHSIQQGAEEIDVVFPYASYLSGNKNAALDFISACKKTCGDHRTLKVILETGAWQDSQLLAEVSQGILLAGADFLKTSTGKMLPGATLEAAAILLLAIKELSPVLKKPLGFKASGGIKTPEQALQYILLAEKIMGRDWVVPQHFRLGASSLVDSLLKWL